MPQSEIKIREAGRGLKMRREPFTFIENSRVDQLRKAYCSLCEEQTGRLNKLVPRFVDGIKDEKFRQCCYCGKLYPIYDLKYFTEYEPKAVPTKNPFESTTKVVTISKKRRKNKHELKSIDNNIEITKLAGKEDKELEGMMENRPGIINYINDDNDDMTKD
ncbi:MAG TPA: hypothetical protein VD710_02380 [Nitrososphaeraceae archaeon]|nr:hypothetical protein [Nitrososphaeraceae archaeon]